MALDPAGIIAIRTVITSHASASGLFADVNGHEPLNAPGLGLSCAVMQGPFSPVGRVSGLGTTSGRLEFTVGIMTPRATPTPQKAEDDVLAAACTLVAAYSGDFEMLLAGGGVPGGLVNCIDLLGAYGEPLGWRPGWLTQDSTALRVLEIVLPVIINDAFGQAA